MRILMAADGSKHGTTDLLAACRILSSGRHHFELLTVAPKTPEGKNKTVQDRLNRRAHRIAEAMQRRVASEGVNAKATVHTGSPTQVLIHCAQGYDAVVVGATSHGDATYPGLGPVASRLAEHSTSSVLLAREGAGEATIRILAPIDGSDASMDGLGKLAELFDLSASDVTLMHVVETPWLRSVDDQDWIDQEASEEDEESELAWQADLDREFTQEGEGILDRARNRLPLRTSVTTIIKHGMPADEILSEANSGNYDLIVVAATGERDLKHRMLGSVSSRVAWNAPCSVLLVRG